MNLASALRSEAGVLGYLAARVGSDHALEVRKALGEARMCWIRQRANGVEYNVMVQIGELSEAALTQVNADLAFLAIHGCGIEVLIGESLVEKVAAVSGTTGAPFYHEGTENPDKPITAYQGENMGTRFFAVTPENHATLLKDLVMGKDASR